MADDAQVDTRPAWSPDRGQLAYVLKDSRKWHIRVIDLESQTERTLTDRAGEYASLSYSPDGRFIAFDGNPDGARGSVIYIISVDTAELTQITDNSVNSSQPSWSR